MNFDNVTVDFFHHVTLGHKTRMSNRLGNSLSFSQNSPRNPDFHPLCTFSASFLSMLVPNSLPALVARCQQVMAHAWMVRTFIKHSDEVEDYPELMNIVRSVFDTARALESRVADPAGYVRMLSKKIGKLRTATRNFREDAIKASTHMNFQQAVTSIEAALWELEELLKVGQALVAMLPDDIGSTPTSDPDNSDSSDDREGNDTRLF